MADFTAVPLLVVFTDFTRYGAEAQRRDDGELATVMNAYYQLAARILTQAGGRIVKFMGDASLAVFPAEAVDRGVLAVLELKDSADRLMMERGWESRLIAKAHFGPVTTGQFGAASDRRFDVIGKTVNVTARLEASGVALSVEAFRQLGPAVRERFKKHTPPVTYIRVEDPHQGRAGR